MQQRRKHFPIRDNELNRDARSQDSFSRMAGIGGSRRGISALWLVLAIPLFTVVLGMVLNVGFLWIARAELENAAIAGAKAGVHPKVACKNDDCDQARQTAMQFVEANRVLRSQLKIKDNDDKENSSNSPQAICQARILFGTVDGKKFHAETENGKPKACLVELSKKVVGPFGWLTGPTIVRIRAVAVPGENGGAPKLVDIEQIITD
ncbi:MAG: hypothetical protein Tsb009_22700 [Planctomycetaceae bacterium]